MRPLLFASHHPRASLEELRLLASCKEALKTLLPSIDLETVLITSSGAESIYQIFFSVYRTETEEEGKNFFFTMENEPAPFQLALEKLQQWGALPCRHTHFQQLQEPLSPKTALVSLSYANPLTGVLAPIEEIASHCKAAKVLLHLDLSAALGKISLERVTADYISIDGPMIGAPAGCGLLGIKKGAPFVPLFSGGTEQQAHRMGRFEPSLLLALHGVLNHAAETPLLYGTEVARLRALFERKLHQNFPTVKRYLQNSSRLPHLTLFGFPGLFNDLLLFFLQRQQLFGSIGGGELQPLAEQLIAQGVPKKEALSAISLSFTPHTTQEEIEEAIERLQQVYKRLEKGIYEI